MACKNMSTPNQTTAETKIVVTADTTSKKLTLDEMLVRQKCQCCAITTSENLILEKPCA